MIVLLMIAAGFVLVFLLTSIGMAIRNRLTGPPTVKGLVRWVEREQQRELDALNEARLDYDERALVERAIKAKHMRILRRLYFPDDDIGRGY